MLVETNYYYGQLSGDQKSGVQEAIKRVRDALNGNDADAIKQAMDEL